MHERVERDLVLPGVVLFLGRQFPVHQEIRDLQVVRRFSELLDGVTAVYQDAGLTVDIRGRAAARGGIGESRIVDSQARTLAVADLLKVGGADSAVGDRQLILFAGAIVRDG